MMTPELLPTLVDRCRPAMNRLLRWKGIPPEDEEDVVQEALLGLLPTRWANVRNPEGLLLAVLAKHCGRYWSRRLRVKVTPIEEVAEERLADVREEGALETRVQVEMLLRSLEPMLSETLRKRFLEEKRFKEIEQDLNLNPGKCRRRLRKGLAAAREKLEAASGSSPSGTEGGRGSPAFPASSRAFIVDAEASRAPPYFQRRLAPRPGLQNALDCPSNARRVGRFRVPAAP